MLRVRTRRFDAECSCATFSGALIGCCWQVLALNKADLLPRDFHPNRVKNWVYREAGRMNIWVVRLLL